MAAAKAFPIVSDTVDAVGKGGNSAATTESRTSASPRTVQPVVSDTRTTNASDAANASGTAKGSEGVHVSDSVEASGVTRASGVASTSGVASASGATGASGAPNTQDSKMVDSAPSAMMSDIQRVQRKWQMASICHFFETFLPVLPIGEVRSETADEITAVSIERAVAEPDAHPDLCVLLRDAIATLLLALKKVSKARAVTHWYEALRYIAHHRAPEFPDCFDEHGLSVFQNYNDGLRFLVESSWAVRMGTLLALCDVAAEEAECVRDALRERDARVMRKVDEGEGGGNVAHDAGTNAPVPEVVGYRLMPFGRCSQRRFYFRVGKARIYSGFKRKGDGLLEVECSDSESMTALVERLEKTGFNKDVALASRIKDVYLPVLLQYEAQVRKKRNKLREIEALKFDGHRRMLRPRRRKVVYTFD